ncbi:MAG TPA: calcium/proton exchanger [Gaiellales bacterium]|nr:calcium/proton exchanger [Gaiellales bacterium]
MTRQQVILAAVVLAASVAAVALDVGGSVGTGTFVVAGVALAGLAWLLGVATEQAGATVGPRTSALLNASFGNLPELVIVVLAINAGLEGVARASIVGSVIGNVLLILGLSLVLGGWRNGVQTFNERLAATNSLMLVLAVAGLAIPTLFAQGHPGMHSVDLLSRWTAALLALSYAGYVYYTQTAPGLRYSHKGEGEPWPRRQAVLVLCLTAVATGIVSEVLVDAIEPVVRAWGVPLTFIGLIVVPFLGNVAEHLSAVRLALRNNLDFSMAIAAGSGIQIALAAPAVAVVASIALGGELTLVFPTLELAALGIAALVSTLIARGGETNWLEGLQLLVIYTVVAVAFWLI